jgi:hypothetical protein
MTWHAMVSGETGRAGVVFLVLVAVIGAYVFIPRIVDPEWRDSEPPWGDRATVVLEPDEVEPEPVPEATEAFDLEIWSTELDRSDPSAVLREHYEDRLAGMAQHHSGVSPTAVRCPEVELRPGGGKVTCVAEYQEGRVHYTVELEDLDIPPRRLGGLMTWYDDVDFDEVIVTQDSVNQAFWRHLGETGRREEGQEMRCDRLAEPVMRTIDQLHAYRCYRIPASASPRVYFLTFGGGGFTFQPWSGLHPAEADDWQPEA